MDKKQITYIVVIALIVAGLSFYGGLTYGKSSVPTRGAGQLAGQFGANGGQRTGGAGRSAGNGFIAGDILAKDATSITVKLRDGSSKIIFYSASTDVQKTVGGSATDLVVGKTVSITGTANADGSITAQSVQLRTTPPTPPQGQSAP